MNTVSPQNGGPGPHGNPGAAGSGRFEEELRAMVVDLAPRQFAVVQVWDAGDGELDGCVAAWGTVYEDRCTQVSAADGASRLVLSSPERAVWWFGREAGVTARLVWLAAPERTAAA
ncbi:hypothetical protein [Streptomyces mangrovi]|uniref:hypothetical protein n=1 Tax=Streptomyces mangrovi TaxID=1206892 RepID=UPI00399D2EF9